MTLEIGLPTLLGDNVYDKITDSLIIFRPNWSVIVQPYNG